MQSIMVVTNEAESFDVWLTVHCSSVWIKRPTRCYLVLYLFLLYRLLNMFRVTLCPSSGADDLVVFFRCVAEPWLCRQSDPVGCLSVHWEALSTTNKTNKRMYECYISRICRVYLMIGSSLYWHYCRAGSVCTESECVSSCVACLSML